MKRTRDTCTSQNTKRLTDEIKAASAQIRRLQDNQRKRDLRFVKAQQKQFEIALRILAVTSAAGKTLSPKTWSPARGFCRFLSHGASEEQCYQNEWWRSGWLGGAFAKLRKNNYVCSVASGGLHLNKTGGQQVKLIIYPGAIMGVTDAYRNE